MSLSKRLVTSYLHTLGLLPQSYLTNCMSTIWYKRYILGGRNTYLAFLTEFTHRLWQTNTHTIEAQEQGQYYSYSTTLEHCLFCSSRCQQKRIGVRKILLGAMYSVYSLLVTYFDPHSTAILVWILLSSTYCTYFLFFIKIKIVS